MAFLHADGFDTIRAITDLTERWDVGTCSTIIPAASTPFGTGQAINLIATTHLIEKAFPSNEDTVFFCFRRKQHAGASSTVNAACINLMDGSTSQITLLWYYDGSFGLRAGGYSATAIPNTLTAGVHAAGIWDSWQCKVVIHETEGSVEVRKNGSIAPVFLATNINTRNSTTNRYANRFRYVMNAPGTNDYLDDIFICSGSGAAPNDWPGDVRSILNRPTAITASAFAPGTATGVGAGSQLTTGATTLTTSANQIAFTTILPQVTGNLVNFSPHFVNAATGSMQVGIYASDGTSGGPGTLLAAIPEVTNVSSGYGTTLTLPTPLPVVAGTTYWAGFISTMGLVYGGVTSGSSPYRCIAGATRLYTDGLPASYSTTASHTANAPAYRITITDGLPLQLVDDLRTDGVDTYIASDAVGVTDLYTCTELPAVDMNVLVAIPYAYMRKSDAGTKSAAIQAKSGETEVTAFASDTLGTSFTYCQGPLTTDPATGAAWTKAGVNALQVGPKVVA